MISRPPSSSPVPSPAPAADPARWAPVPVSPGSVLGTGTLTSPGGALTGTVEVTSDHDGGVEVVLSGFATSDPRMLQATFSSTPGATFSCYNPEGYAFALPTLGPEPDQEFPMGRLDDLPSSDPSFLDSLVVYAVPEAAEVGVDGCYGDILAIAEMQWNSTQDIPPAVDAGARAGASGTVELTAAGTPATYQVAAGDTLSDIAERFTLDPEVILYLSAGRISPQGIVDDETVYAGETLKLDASAR
ncbi:LysM peptidoglycan-binding domain-containing protein [Herbiconiux ginsengi]|nr:LysM domain-containing protein [Herbiconiux ginsengi]